MSRRSAVEQIVIEEKKVSESLFKLISAREKGQARRKWEVNIWNMMEKGLPCETRFASAKGPSFR